MSSSTSKLYSGVSTNSDNKTNLPLLAGVGAIAALASVFALSHYIDFSSVFAQAVDAISGLGPLGYVYFALVSVSMWVCVIG